MIISAAAVEGRSALPILADIRQHQSPASRIIIFATRFDIEERNALTLIGITDYMRWSDLGCTTLRCYLTLMFTREIILGSPAMTIAYTAHERTVLQRLAEGLTQKQIAEAEHLSLRTVKRTVAALETKLDAPCQFLLGMKAEQLGLVHH